jgi:hypothetical protein
MVVIEVFTGRIPFYQLRNEAVILKVISGVRPEKPIDVLELGLFDSVWSMVQRCWHNIPGQRPLLNDVLSCFEEAVVLFVPSAVVARNLNDVGEDLQSEAFSLCKSCIASFENCLMCCYTDSSNKRQSVDVRSLDSSGTIYFRRQSSSPDGLALIDFWNVQLHKCSHLKNPKHTILIFILLIRLGAVWST